MGLIAWLAWNRLLRSTPREPYGVQSAWTSVGETRTDSSAGDERHETKLEYTRSGSRYCQKISIRHTRSGRGFAACRDGVPDRGATDSRMKDE